MEYDVSTPRATSTRYGLFFYHINIPRGVKASAKCHIACPEKEQDPIPSEFGGALRSYRIEEKYDGNQQLDDVSYNIYYYLKINNKKECYQENHAFNPSVDTWSINYEPLMIDLVTRAQHSG